MMLSGVPGRVAGALLAAALVGAPHVAAAQGGSAPGGVPGAEGTAAPPAAGGPPASPGLAGERPAGRTGPLLPGPPPELGLVDEAQDEQGSPATAERAVSFTAGVSGRRADGADPAAAGGPGRQVPPPPAVPAVSAEREAALARQREVARAFECPREQIVRMLETAVEASEISASMGLEREVLQLCRDRWTVLRELMDAEQSLAEILLRSRVEREQAALALGEERREALARTGAARQVALEAARAAERRRLETEERAEQAQAAVVVVPEPEPEPEPHEIYAWFSILGSAGSLRAGVTDGAGRWWVREGDELAGGVRIAAISSSPPRVRISGGPPSGLPYRSLGR